MKEHASASGNKFQAELPSFRREGKIRSSHRQKLRRRNGLG
jgi:hypothetical protein